MGGSGDRVSVTQTSWDRVSRFNIFASGFSAGLGIAYFALHGDTLLLGITIFAALTCWHAAHIKPNGE